MAENSPPIWDYTNLWYKAKLYAKRAHEYTPEDPLFGFWAFLGLEFLARSTLAKIHPVLLADPKEGGDNVLYAFGYGTTDSPKSIPAKAVFFRCTHVVPNFTEKKELKQCLTFLDRRNLELHTGVAAFEDFPTTVWLANYYRLCNMLLASQGKKLDDLLPQDAAKAASKMVEAAEKDLEKSVKESIAAYAKVSKDKDPAGKAQAAARAAREAVPWLDTAEHECPACKTRGSLSGERVKISEPRLDVDSKMIIRQVHVLPTKFVCHYCGLLLDGHDQLHHAGLGGQFTLEYAENPSEYFDPPPNEDYYEPDYGND